MPPKDKLRGLQPGSTMWLVIHALADGPQTMIELSRATGLSRELVRPHLSIQCKNKRIFVVDYRRDSDGGRTYIRPIYGLNPPAKAPKKPARFDSAEAQRRYRSRRRTLVNSVFALGVPNGEWRITNRRSRACAEVV